MASPACSRSPLNSRACVTISVKASPAGVWFTLTGQHIDNSLSNVLTCGDGTWIERDRHRGMARSHEARIDMKAIRVEQHGGPGVLELKEIATLEPPGLGQAIVRVRAAGVNFMDVAQRRGMYPREVPFTPGVEGSGVVEAIGEGVSNVKLSDRVAFTGQQGAYAEAILVEANQLIPLPDDFTFEMGAAFPLQGMTAHYLIREFCKPKAGAFVLVHAAAGGLGGLLVQWARHLGAVVIGTISSEAKARIARAAGAEHTIVYTDQDFVAETMRVTGGRGADIIFDSVGLSTSKGDLDAVAITGHIVFCGASSGPPEPIAPRVLMERSVTLSGSGRWARTPEELMSRARDVISGIRGGWLKPNIGALLPLEQASEAHHMLESRRTHGKLVLTVPGQ
jgi:NADPH:quinone reductase